MATMFGVGRRLGEGREDSGLGHGAGLLLVDVAAHATGVDAWKNQRDSRGGGGQRGAERQGEAVSWWLRLPGSRSDSSVEDNWWADSTP